MPVRPRRQRHAAVAWTPAIALALTCGPDPLRPIPEATLRTAWELYGDAILTDYGATARPWAWWRFAPRVPDELRGRELPLLYPVEQADEIAAEQADLERRRGDFLTGMAA